MNLTELRGYIGARIGVTFTSSTKPTSSEVDSFIHQSMKLITELLPPVIFKNNLSDETYTPTTNSLALPSGYGKSVSLINITQNKKYTILDNRYIEDIKTGRYGILLPDLCSAIDGDSIYINSYNIGDVITLRYMREYDSANIGDYDVQFEPLVIAYSTYLSKYQDEETVDANTAMQEFSTLLQGFGVIWKVAGNE